MADDAGLDEVIGTLTTVMALNYNSYLSGLSHIQNALNSFYSLTKGQQLKSLTEQLATEKEFRNAAAKQLTDTFVKNTPALKAMYENQIKNSDSVISKLKASIVAEEAAAASFGTLAIVGAAAAAAIAYSWAKVATTISDTVQRAERLQTTSSFLQEWNGLSVLAGQNTEQFAQSIEGLHKNLNSLHNLMPIQSMSEMVSGINLPLTAIGLNRSQLAGLGSTEQLKLIANGLSNVHDKTLQLSIATELFGDSGFYMLSYLQKGAAGVDELKAKMESYHAVLSDDQSASIQKTVVAWREFKLAMQGVYLQISAFVSPVLTLILNLLTLIITTVTGLVSAFSPVLRIVGALANLILSVVGLFSRLVGFVIRASTDLGPLLWIINKIVDAINYVADFIAHPIDTLTGHRPSASTGGSSIFGNGDNPQLASLIGLGKSSLATQQEFVKNLVKSAPPHMPYAW